MSQRRLQLYFIALACFWSGSFIGIKVVLASVPPVFGAALRVGLALCFLLVIFGARRKPLLVPKGARRRVWLTGIFSIGLPLSVLFWGERHVSAGVAGVLNGTTPLFVFVIAALFLRELESITPRKLAGLCLGWTGIFLLSLSSFQVGGHREELLGMFAILVMAASYAVGTLMNRKLLAGDRSIDFHANLVQQHVSSVALMLAVSALTETWPAPATLARPSLVAALVYLSLCSTALGFMMYYRLIGAWGAVRASTVGYLIPVLAFFWDYVFFSHAPTALEIAGGSLVLVGVALVQVPRTALNAAWEALSRGSRRHGSRGAGFPSTPR